MSGLTELRAAVFSKKSIGFLFFCRESGSDNHNTSSVFFFKKRHKCRNAGSFLWLQRGRLWFPRCQLHWLHGGDLLIGSDRTNYILRQIETWSCPRGAGSASAAQIEDRGRDRENKMEYKTDLFETYLNALQSLVNISRLSASLSLLLVMLSQGTHMTLVCSSGSLQQSHHVSSSLTQNEVLLKKK